MDPGHPWSFDDATNVRGCTGSAVPAGRPTPARQQAVLGQLATAFFRRHLAAGPASPLLGDRGLATRIAGVPVVTSYDAPSASRVDIDRAAQRTVSAFGTGIRAQGLRLGHRRLKTPAIGQAPPHGWSPHDLAVRTIRWRARHGRVTYRLPTPAIRGMRALSLRLAVDTWTSAGPAVVDIDLRDRPATAVRCASGCRRSGHRPARTGRPCSAPCASASHDGAASTSGT